MLAALQKLPEGQREAVWLRHVEGRWLAEIAVTLKRTEAAAANLVRHGLETLRKQK